MVVVANLVRARVGDVEVNVAESIAKRNDLPIVEGTPAWKAHNRPQPVTRADGRRLKPKTTVAKAAAAKKEKDQTAVTEPARNEGDTQ